MKKLDIKKDEKRHEKVKEVAKSLTSATPGTTAKIHNISVRLTEEEYQSLLKQVEESDSFTISTYIKRLLKKGL